MHMALPQQECQREMDHAYYYQAGDSRLYHAMRQKPARDVFFSLRDELQAHRPTSVTTEFVDTDWDEEVASEPEDNSPRVSLQSSGQPSITTVSSYDEAPTPRSSRGPETFVEPSPKQVEGPRGPHLFRSSADASLLDDDAILTLSPLTPDVSHLLDDLLERPQAPRKSSPLQYTREQLDLSALASWTPRMVAQSMANAGIEPSVADRFIENDINGEILTTLKFEDLRELGIASFGIRTKVWHQIQALRDSRPPSPRPSTPIEDAPSREARKETGASMENGDTELKRCQSSSRRRRRRPSANDDTVTPMESVSIIAIEQVIPKPHHCSKGENCSKWKKQQRAIEEFQRANPTVDMSAGGTVLIIGDAGNPETAKAIDPNETHRPMSDAVPSVVASSDVLGPGGLPPLQYLEEAALRKAQLRGGGGQDNVRQFLNFQYQQNKSGASEVLMTPPFELTPAAMAPNQALRRLPKLSIPDGTASQRLPQQALQRRRSTSQHEHISWRVGRTTPLSPEPETPQNPRRLGSPFSEWDVPVTTVPAGPIARNVSQSVPPDMGCRASLCHTPPRPRSQSRASIRQPSFHVLPAVDEHTPVRAAPETPSPKTSSPRTGARPRKPLQAPPVFNYPWSPSTRTTFEYTIPPRSTFKPGGSPEAPAAADGITYRGHMKKRKMRLFRHEWQDGFFTLRGTRLNMHKDANELDRTLEYVDIDDYAIACSSLASTSKLSAAFKAMRISHSREKSDPIAAFSFQLIPQDKDDGLRLRKRDSSLHATGTGAEAVNSTGKTHHFAVKSRDERIDWMRELMLAKALKRKGEDFEISVNGNMI